MNILLNEKINEYINKYDLNSLDIIEDAREFVIMLISDITGYTVIDIKLGKVKINDTDLLKLDKMLYRISNDKIPPEYLTNVSYLYGMRLFVNENVLIPRQDTETLIEHSIKTINENGYKSLLDLCTGSGVIGIACANNSCIKDVTLLDFSDEALKVTKKNVEILDKNFTCKIIKSNMFNELYKMNYKYDIIVSNPPYLTKDEMNEISDFVKKEPSIALDGGLDGHSFYNNIFENARNFLNNNGFIAVEIGYRQADDVVKIIKKYSEYSDIKVIKDINNKDRVVTCHFQKI